LVNKIKILGGFMDNWTIDFLPQEVAAIFSEYYGKWLNERECENKYTEKELKEVILDLLGV
jgi:hypothetical protein